jgi:antitoxin component YwqK of YwqJK toxin-antitoxin module
MKNLLQSIVNLIFLLIPFLGLAKEKIIVLKHDTINLRDGDKVFYRKGDDFSGEVKYGSDSYFTVVQIDSGYITKRTDFLANGMKRLEENFSKGRYNGPYKEWNYSGVLIICGHYSNSYADSIWTFYYSNGIKETEGAFLPDTTKLIDDFKIIRSEISSDPPYDTREETRICDKHSPPHGEWVFYNFRGKISKRLVFDKGILKSFEVGDHPEE